MLGRDWLISVVCMAQSGSEPVVAATFKILVLGDSNVGKSSLIKSYFKGAKLKDILPTIGIDFTDMILSVRGTKVRLRVWDTAGQEKFHTFTKQFFRGTQGVLLVYDITNMASFQRLHKWNSTLMEAGLTDISIIVVGNKADLEDLRIVPKETAQQFAIQKCKTQSIETSVHSGHHVCKTFHMLAEQLIFKHGIFQPGREASVNENSLAPRTSDSIKLETAPKMIGDGKKCCHSSS